MALGVVSEDGGCICLRFCRGESSGETRALLEEGSGLAHSAEARPGWLEQRPVTEPTWQRQEAGGPYAEIGSQCLAGTLLRTRRAARSGDSGLLCSFVCLFCFLRSFWLPGWRQ